METKICRSMGVYRLVVVADETGAAMTTPSGYITDQRCPTDPEHGKALAMDNGMWCPHVGHYPPKGKMTQHFWHYLEWERIKDSALESPTNQLKQPTQARAIKVRKSIVRQTNSRRTGKG